MTSPRIIFCELTIARVAAVYVSGVFVLDADRTAINRRRQHGDMPPFNTRHRQIHRQHKDTADWRTSCPISDTCI